MNRYIYICLILSPNSYENGINDVIDLINKLFPYNTLVIEKYTSLGLEEQTFNDLDDFFNKYSTGDRIILSNKTSILLEINKYLEINNLNIISISLSASSSIIKNLSNTLTYGYFNQYMIMSYFMIFRDYQMKNIKILFQYDSLNQVFFRDLILLLKYQAKLLGININVDTLEVNKKYKFKKRTSIILLVDPNSIINYVNEVFLNQIPCDSFISLFDLNNSTKDIFKNIPTIVFIPVPLNYTSTTQLVYDSVFDKSKFYYISYPMFDILYTLQFISNTIIPLTLQNYISINPFNTIPAAWTNSSSFILNISGSKFGTFDCVFTKNVLVEKNLELFNSVNSGGTGVLPESQSICKTIGIVPFFTTNTYYCEQNYNKIYNNSNKLIAVRFDKNNTTILLHNKELVYNIAEDIENKFILKYGTDGFFIFLNKLINPKDPLPKINQTLNKNIVQSYLKI